MMLDVLNFASLILLVIYTALVLMMVLVGVPAIPSHPRVAREIEKIIHGSRSTKKVAELGAAYGGQLLYLARNCTKIHFTGFELNPIAWIILRLRFISTNAPSVVLRQENFMRVSISHFDMLLAYLSIPAMKQLQQKLVADWKTSHRKKHVTIISYAFPFPDWKPVRTIRIKGYFFYSNLYVYTITPPYQCS